MRFGRWTQIIWRNLLPPSSGYESSFLLTLKMEVPGSAKMLVPHHIPWAHNLNTFYTENTDFICILLAFRVAQHDSSSCSRSIVKLCLARVDFSLNSCYKRIMRHRGIKFGIVIPIGSTSLLNFMLEVALLCVKLVWIYKLCQHQLCTRCVYWLHCVLKYSKQETLLVAMFVVRIV